MPVTLQALLQVSFSVVNQLMIGHLGGQSIAAVGLAGKFISIYTVLLGAITAAAGIMLAQYLGQKNEENVSKSFYMNLLYCVIMGIIFTFICVFLGKEIMYLYNKDTLTITNATNYLKIFAFAVISPVKVQNMILDGGIIRSGGKTKYIMWVDIIGTWLFGVPLAFISAFILKLSIPYVYFILSLEEVVRLIIAIVLFKRKKWMQRIE